MICLASLLDSLRECASEMQVLKGTLSSEGPGGKRPKRSGPDGEVQKSPIVITVDSLEQAYDVLLALEGTAQGVPGEACVSLEDEISVEGPPSADNVVDEAPFVEIAAVPLLFARPFNLAIGGLDRLN